MIDRKILNLIICLLIGLYYSEVSLSQDIRINELVPSNITMVDEDGDSPDWIELINLSDKAISLKNWSITDDFKTPDKWIFPDYTISPNGFSFIWASDKDRKEESYVRTLLSEGDTVKYFIPSSTSSTSWRSISYDDSDWSSGPLGIGYGDDDDNTIVPDGTPFVFIRKAFTSVPEIDREAVFYSSGELSRINISNEDGILKNGENVLAISVHNVNTNSSDLSLIAFLSARFRNNSKTGIATPEFLELPNGYLHSNFKLSNEGETVYLFDDNALLVDSLTYPILCPNDSYGLSPDNDKAHVYFETTTPAYENSNDFYSGINEASIIFSKVGGLTDTFTLELSGISTEQTIRYTTNSEEPDSSSTEYTRPIKISTNNVIRASVFSEDKLPSKPQTQVYLIDKSHSLPVISIVTESENLYNNQTGIYIKGDKAETDFPYFGSNFWQDWERPAHFSFIEEEGNNGFSANVGIKIFGGWSRGHEQKSFSIFARKEYGSKEINYPIFPDAVYNKFQALVLRNSGNDWLNTNIRDATLTSLLEDSGLDYQLYRPAVTYLNGQYWGIYNIREKINEHFLASKHGVDPDEVDIVEKNSKTIHGDNKDYVELIDFIKNNDLSNQAEYDFIGDQIDLENFAMYQIAQIYFDNTDWPGNNIKFWKAKGGKWRWIIFDTDFGFGIWEPENYVNNTIEFAIEANGPGWPNPPWSTLLFRSLLKNSDFQHLFINRFADELNSRFLPENVVSHISEAAQHVRPEIEAHFNRWNRNSRDWELKITQMRNFGFVRPNHIKDHILEVFDLPAYHKITIENKSTQNGYVVINNRLRIDEEKWDGDYFKEVPIVIEAVPAKGYIFSHWEGDSRATISSIGINPTRDKTFIPVFEKSQSTFKDIVINEINYNSSKEFNTGDWVELYNPNPYPIDLTGWILSDSKDDNAFSFPINSTLDAEDYLVVTKNHQKFSALISENDVIGNFSFGLSNTEDQVRLYDANNQLIDEVMYTSKDPWPLEPNGDGWTLELISPDLDNSEATNWSNIHINGSPGKSNQKTTSTNGIVKVNSLSILPNPARDQINIFIESEQNRFIEVDIFNAAGTFIQKIYSEEFIADRHLFSYNIAHLNKGVYIIRVTTSEASYSAKVIKL